MLQYLIWAQRISKLSPSFSMQVWHTSLALIHVQCTCSSTVSCIFAKWRLTIMDTRLQPYYYDQIVKTWEGPLQTCINRWERGRLNCCSDCKQRVNRSMPVLSRYIPFLSVFQRRWSWGTAVRMCITRMKWCKSISAHQHILVTKCEGRKGGKTGKTW